MENILQQNVEVTSGTIISLSVTAAVLAVLPVICAVLWKKHCGKSVSLASLFIGAAGFLVSARVLELGVHMVCIVWDTPISRFINGSTLAYVIYGAGMAGIFEECGRYVVIRFLMKKNKTRENMVMYGIGHGGIEVWVISLMSTVSMLAAAASGNGRHAELPGGDRGNPGESGRQRDGIHHGCDKFQRCKRCADRAGAGRSYGGACFPHCGGGLWNYEGAKEISASGHPGPRCGGYFPGSAAAQRGEYAGYRGVAMGLGNSACDPGGKAV